MPSSTLTPDPPTVPGQPAPPGPLTAPGQPTPPGPLTAPGQPTPPEPLAAPGQPTPPGPLAAPGQPTPPAPAASSGLRLVTVPAGWPPYDCETHGAACPVAREAAATNPHVSRPAPAPAGAPGPTALSPAAGSGYRAAQAIRPGDRGDTGGLSAAEADRRLDDGPRPGPDRRPHPVGRLGPATQNPAHRDVAARGFGRGDDSGHQFRSPIAGAGHAIRAHARASARARLADPPGAMALHRNRDRLTRGRRHFHDREDFYPARTGPQIR